MRSYLNTLRLLSRDGRLLLLAQCLSTGSYLGIYVVLFNLYLARLGYGTEFIGLTNGIAIFFYAFLCIPAGALGRKWGVRRVAILGGVLTGVGLLLLPLAEALPGIWRSVWLVLMYALAWGAAAPYLVSLTPFLLEVTDARARGHVFSLSAALNAISVFLGSLIGGFLPGVLAGLIGTTLDTPDPYRYALMVGGVLWLLLVPVLLQTREIAPMSTNDVTTTASKAPYAFMLLLAIFMLLRASTEGAGKTFFNVYLDGTLLVPTATIGSIMAFGQLLSIPAALATPLLVARWGRERTLILVTVFLGLSLIPMALIANWQAATLSYMTFTALLAVINPVYTVYSQESVGPGWRSTMSGASFMSSGLGLGWTAVGGGYIIAGIGYAAFFGMGVFLAVCSGLLLTAYLIVSSRRARRIVAA